MKPAVLLLTLVVSSACGRPDADGGSAPGGSPPAEEPAPAAPVEAPAPPAEEPAPGDPAEASAPRYTIVEIPAVEDPAAFDATALDPTALNARGQVVGSYTVPGATRAFLFDAATGSVRRIGGDLGHEQLAAGINDAGQVAMTVWRDATGARAVRWQDEVATPVGALPSGPYPAYSTAHAINALGWIAGSSQDASGRVRAFLWDGAGLHALGSLEGSHGDAGCGISAAGVVVGDSAMRAAVFARDDVRDLGTLGADGLASALGVNAHGRVVGYANVPTSNGGVRTHAFRYDLTGGPMVDLSPSAPPCAANGVNDAGDAVGACAVFHDASTPGTRAMLWRGRAQLDVTAALGDPSWILAYARAVNDRGQIVGTGIHHGEWRAYLLTPE